MFVHWACPLLLLLEPSCHVEQAQTGLLDDEQHVAQRPPSFQPRARHVREHWLPYAPDAFDAIPFHLALGMSLKCSFLFTVGFCFFVLCRERARVSYSFPQEWLGDSGLSSLSIVEAQLGPRTPGLGPLWQCAVVGDGLRYRATDGSLHPESQIDNPKGDETCLHVLLFFFLAF